jgi:hypothetical protein
VPVTGRRRYLLGVGSNLLGKEASSQVRNGGSIPPTLMTIKAQRQKLLAKLIQIDDKLTALMDKCKHKGYTYSFKANTGNYDPYEDCYWTIYECPTCGKVEKVDGSQSQWKLSKFEGTRI